MRKLRTHAWLFDASNHDGRAHEFGHSWCGRLWPAAQIVRNWPAVTCLNCREQAERHGIDLTKACL